MGGCWLWVDARLLPVVANFGWTAWHEAIVPGVRTIVANALPAREHYDWRHWYLAILPGAYASGLLVMAAWLAQAAGLVARKARPHQPNANHALP